MSQPTDQKANGVYYTPPTVVRYIVRRTLRLCDAPTMPRVLDPACGDGAFLVEVLRQLRQRRPPGNGSAVPLRHCGLATASIFGVDCDISAVASARRRMVRYVQALDEQGEANNEAITAISHNLRVGDALVDVSLEDPAAPPSLPWRECFPGVFEEGGFDVIVGNPPYVSIRLLSKTRSTQLKRYLRDHYRCAHKAFDLYVLFLERALELLRPGGVCGMIVPNKVASLEYAARCRDMLLRQTTIHEITDLSSAGLFRDASVYPYVLIWKKSLPSRRHAILVTAPEIEASAVVSRRSRRVLQKSLSATGFHLHGAIDVESRVPTATLGERVTLHSGTTGFSAARVAAALQEKHAIDHESFEFIVTGNIDRYVVRRGEVRFMKQQYRRPVISTHAECLTESKRRLYRQPKLVLAGMTRRLEVAYDAGGLALGVQVYAAAEPQDDARYLLALLNSQLLSHLFRLRFRAKQLGGGYFAINKRQLSQLPIRMIETADREAVRTRERIIGLATRRIAASTHGDQSVAASLDLEIDLLVYRLYGVTPAEVREIDAAA